MGEDKSDVDRQIEELRQRMRGFPDGHERSAMRVARELRRLAAAEHRLIPYLRANLFLMRTSFLTLEPGFGAEIAIESIALLEDEGKARQFQSNFPEEEYYQWVAWMLPKAYHELADNTGERAGYNSEGAHEAISEGMEVCRRLGNESEIAHFREYAATVFASSGDIEMAVHHARDVATAPPSPDQNADRRASAIHTLAYLFLLSGQLEDARDAALQAMGLVGTSYSPISGRLLTQMRLEESLLLLGSPEEFETRCNATGFRIGPALFPPEGECPVFDLACAQRDALAACCNGDHARALEILSHWDAMLMRSHCLYRWFHVRLQRIAVCRMAGDTKAMQSLAKPLELRAKAARDWLSLARLKGMLEGTVHPAPWAFLNSATSGPYAPPRPVAVSAGAGGQVPGAQEAAAASPQEEERPAQEAPATPLGAKLDAWVDRWRESGGRDEVFAATLDEMLAVRPDEVTDPEDAARLIYCAGYAARVVQRAIDAWRWAEPFARLFPQHGTTLNVLADLGALARSTAGDGADQIVASQRIDSLFRTSLDIDHERSRNFARAGFYYLDAGRKGDAERCLARSFKLDRTDPQIALTLSDLYAQAHRPRDGLAVLDLALRAGCADSRVPWQAGIAAFSLGLSDAALAYFDRFETLEPEQRWTQHYRAWALLELDRVPEALHALETESRRAGDGLWLDLEILRAWAAGKLGNVEELQERLSRSLSIPIREVDYLSDMGLVRLFDKLYAASLYLPEDAPEHKVLGQLLLQSGLAPDDFFEKPRKARAAVEGVNFYVCQVKQPLDDRWAAWPGRRSGQEAWTAYIAHWGVLALHEAEARQIVLDQQKECFPLPAEVIDCTLNGEGYTDSPGIVWQGRRDPLDGGNASERP